MFLVSFFAYVLITVDVASGILSNSNTDSNSDWYYNYWCNQHDLEYLDDSRCRKQFPSVYDRNDWACPTRFTQEQVENNGFKLNGLLNTDNVDVEILGDIVTNGADVCVIVSKRVLTEENDTGNFISNSNAQLYNKYFCAGNYSIDDYYETWSSSKIFAVSNAASHLQANESTCENLLSLNSDTTGKHGRTPLGDLISIICSYDTTAAYSSNSLSSYFHDIGFRSDLYNLIHSGWLYESDDNVFNAQSQSLGGNYGEQTPDDLSFALSTDDYTCTADKDPWEQTFDNSISALSAVEMTRRIVQHREIPDSMKYPGMTWEDVKNILYGAEQSILFPGLGWGGMSADTAIFLQSALNMTKVEEDSQGKFRIFSKLGAGYSSSRSKGEIVSNAYGCFPVLHENGMPVVNSGYEFSIHVRGSIDNDVTLLNVQEVVLEAMTATVNAIMEGKLL